MNRLIFLLIASAALRTGIARAGVAREVEDVRILSFEGSARPFAALEGSTIGISAEHYKHGTHSARWQWSRDGAQLRIAAPVGYLRENPDPTQTAVPTFVFWVYAPRETDGSVRFEFRRQDRTCAWFDYGLHFRGWRGAWVAFDRDMQGTPEEGMDELVLTVQGAQRGELFFDHLILSSFQDVRHHTSDFQAPFINAATTNHWLVLLRSWRNPLPDAPHRITEAERRDMAMIEARLRTLLLEGRKAVPMKTLRSRFAAYGIAENPDGTLRGLPVWFVRYAETYLNLGHPDVKQRYADRGQLLRRCNDLMYQIAVTYNLTADAAQRIELARMYLLLTRHLLDQGFAAGSAQGTLHHLGYSMRNFYTGPVLMRDVLREAGLEHDVQQAMEWFSGVGEVKLPPCEPGMDIDAFNTSLIGRLASILMLPDGPQKAVWLACFSRWVDNGYRIAEGLAPCLKSDGTVFHHRHHYPAYAVGGFDGAVNAVWLLSRTRFGVSAESHENLRRALLEMRFYCNLHSFPLALSGRHPDGRGALVPWHYARLAEAGTPDGGQRIDRELAAAYLRLAPREDKYTRRFLAAGIAPEPSPEGHRVYGYNASASHRRADWLVTVAGHSRYLWSAEIYRGANHYGRYLTHGSLEVLSDGDPVSLCGSGFRQEGWDWCHIPGTTALEIPMERMKADIRNVDTCSGYEEMLLSDEAFAGGASHLGRDGAFGMVLHEHDKYNGSLRAKKSWFFFGNRVVCLGTDIENAAPGGLHTTLFQNYLAECTAPTEVNGEAVGAFPCRAEFASGCLLRDNLRNAYFVPYGNVVLTRRRQHSLHEETDAPTENDFEKAYIDHGGVTRDGRYEYMLAVHPTEAEVGAWSERLPYEVCAAGSALHAVRDLQSGTYAAVVFEAAAQMPGSDAVRAVWAPCVFLASRDAAGVLTLSVADPDLRLYDGFADELFAADGRRIERSIYSRAWIDCPSKASEVRVTLVGRWQAVAAPAGCRIEAGDVNTEVYVRCREGATCEIKLAPLS